ncbi:MAG: ExbD/TolR family protein [Mariprofundaceae bacterium]
MKLRQKKREGYTVDITPLVDVVFLMLIFFLVSTTFKVGSSLKLDLPSSKMQEETQDTKEVVISISAAGQLYVSDEAVDDEGLRRRVLNASKGDPGIRIVLRADAEAQHKRVVFALDTLRQLGLNKVAIATLFEENNP